MPTEQKMPLPPATVRRLALIRFMYQEGLQQSRRPSPLFVTALLTFHDAVELFLHAAGERVQAEPKDQSFMSYFAVLKEVGPMAKEGMSRLNKARIGLKHHGLLPHEEDMEFFRASVKAFFDENTPTVFGVAFSEISLVDMVECESARMQLATAEAAWKSGRGEDARACLALAYAELLCDYRGRNRATQGSRMPFDFGPSLAFMSASRAGLERDAGKLVDALLTSVKRMRSALETLALGIDYKRYVEFDLLTPTVQRFASGKMEIVPTIGGKLSQEAFDRCFSFVIETALKLQEFDFTFASAMH